MTAVSSSGVSGLIWGVRSCPARQVRKRADSIAPENVLLVFPVSKVPLVQERHIGQANRVGGRGWGKPDATTKNASHSENLNRNYELLGVEF